jgi:hypothetical protein
VVRALAIKRGERAGVLGLLLGGMLLLSVAGIHGVRGMRLRSILVSLSPTGPVRAGILQGAFQGPLLATFDAYFGHATGSFLSHTGIFLWHNGWKSHFMAHPYGKPDTRNSIVLAKELATQDGTFGFHCGFVHGAAP